VTGHLRHFWFEFDLPFDAPCPPGTREGVGVTAADRSDAWAIVRASVFGGGPVPAVRCEFADVVIHELCPWLVLPNMAEPAARGVWFPAGYAGAER
jgi:hypothetical protein